MNNSHEKKWVVSPNVPLEVEAQLGDFPLGLRKLLYNRGIYQESQAIQYLNSSGPLHDPFLFEDMQKALERIKKAITAQEPIVVYGDYDADGICATALLVQVMQGCGALVTGYIPDRFDEGYGLNEDALKDLFANGTNLVVTVDCGIRSAREVEIAQKLGMDLIISDHHYPGSRLPPAYAIINPKNPQEHYPDQYLSGVGLAYKIAQGLCKMVPDTTIDPNTFIDLVAVGTVADIVPLRGENRSLVKAGLATLRAGKNIGLQSLAEAAGLRASKLTARDIGFMLAPRLNAAGRLSSARLSYDLLTASDHQTAKVLANQLDDLNRQRQNLVLDLVSTAQEEIQQQQAMNIVISFHQDYHQGLVGLVASRLVDEHYRPAIVGQVKGEYAVASCRSIPEFHITDALDHCADLFVRHGGHEMAAGFTIALENIPEFCQRMQVLADEKLAGRQLTPTLRADMEIELRKVPSDILERIELIEPVGQDNPEVVFISRGVQVLNKKGVGNEQQHLSLQLKDGQKIYHAIAFRQGHLAKELPAKIDILYAVTQNDFNGLVSTQLNIKDIKPAANQ